jgi:hypothetical protein
VLALSGELLQLCDVERAAAAGPIQNGRSVQVPHCRFLYPQFHSALVASGQVVEYLPSSKVLPHLSRLESRSLSYATHASFPVSLS